MSRLGWGGVIPIVSLATVLLCASSAMAAPTLLTTQPVRDGDEAVFFVGGVDDGGRSLKISGLEVHGDGQPLGPPSTQTLKDWAIVSAEGSATWRPPLSAGLVYLWVEGVPAGVLDGIHAFFQRTPSRTPVYPTVYGRMRQGRAQLTASDISRLDEVPYLEAYRPNLIEAIRLDFGDLAADPAPLKVLLVVTDGRDFADPKGDGPGDFSRLGRELRKAGITPLILAFPAPLADAAQAASNLRDLHAAAGGFLQTVDQVEDIENALESLGQGLADLARVRVATPWSWRAFGGAHRIAVRLSASGGTELNAEIGSISWSGGGGVLVMVLGVLLAAGALAAVVVMALRGRRGRGAAARNPDQILVAAHDLIRRGASPERAVEQLTRSFPNSLADLIGADAETLKDARFPYFRTRPGRLRLQEIRDILAKTAGARTEVSSAVFKLLANALEGHMAAEAAADMIAALVPVDDWMAFANLDLDRLARTLRTAGTEHSVLRSPLARTVALTVQDALRSRGQTEQGVVIGWLVRCAGPGRRGETFKLGDRHATIGRSPTCSLRLTEDPSVAAEHAEIKILDGEFTIAPLGGPLRIEGAAIERQHVLVDGETVELGASQLVFKSASVGNLIAASHTRGRPPSTGRGNA